MYGWGLKQKLIPVFVIWMLISMVAVERVWAGISFSSPANGATVAGTVTVVLNPAAGTSWSNWYLDGVYEGSTPPASFSWNTTSAPNGTHNLTATAFNSSGGMLGSAASTVTVANGVSSGAVSFTSPANGATVAGTTTISVANAGSTSWSNIYVDGVYVSSTPPSSLAWNTAAIANGAHSISATAFGSGGGNLGTSIVNVTVANGSGSSAVTITSPSSGSTVSGTVSIAYSEGSGVGWINTYVDGNYLASSPPASVSWPSGSVSNGSHTISANAYNSSGSEVGTSSVAVTVANGSGSGPSHFPTLPPGSTLPSGATCASEVRLSGFEPRPDNYTANHTVPSDLSTMHSTTLTGGAPASNFDRVDGNFTGTTDEIIQWGACKWGFDEDLVRAIAAEESWWRQTPSAGDLTYNTSLCPAGATYTSDGTGCYLSYGIVQVKSSDYGGTFPSSQQSTAFAIDYKLAYQRACYEGQIGYLSSRSSDYPSSNADDMLWGCVDQWYSGTWWNGSDDGYLSDIQGYITSKPWLDTGF
ncbi:MAG TPA: Ig-like domain-containing protein [Chloroflexota bacterium]|nr:Ig-like domain-containing protein [Chloroflexota bacterium]